MILITGDMGFIGTHLKEALNNFKGFDMKNGLDIRNKYDLELAFECNQFDTVIHLAALAGVRRSKLYPDEYISTNIEGTWNVGKMCEKYGCRLISFSSSSVYGNSIPPTKENDQKEPISLYGITKLAGEKIVNNLEIPTTIIRPFTVYGQGGRNDQVIYKWLNQYKAGKKITVYGDGESSRGYVHINDLVSVIKKLVSMEWSWKHEDFNIGGVEIIKLKDIIKLFKSVYPLVEFNKEEKPADDVKEQYADISKAKKILGYKPEIKFNETVESIFWAGK